MHPQSDSRPAAGALIGGGPLPVAEALRMAARLTNTEEDLEAVTAVVLALLGAGSDLSGDAADAALARAGVPDVARRLLVAADGPAAGRPPVDEVRAGLEAGALEVEAGSAASGKRGVPRLLEELRGRRVLRTALFYVGGSVAVVEAAALFVPMLGGSPALVRLLAILAVCGLPVALVLSWSFDVAPALGSRRWPRMAAIAAVTLVCALGAAVLWRGGPEEPAAAAGSAPDPAHLAVLPFSAVGGGEELAALAEQLQMRLIDGLGAAASGITGNRQLRVLSHADVLPFVGTALKVDSLRERRGVGTILEGSVEQVGDRLDVLIRLVDTVTGDQFHTSSSTHATDQIGLLGAVADSVTQLVRRRLGPVVRQRMSLLETRSPAAFERLTLAKRRGTQFEATFGAGDLAAAAGILADADSMLAAAERLDPTWVEPVVERGKLSKRRALVALARGDTAAADAAVVAGIAHAERALERWPGEPSALQLRGDLRYFRVLTTASADRVPGLREAAERDLLASLPGSRTPAAALRMLSEVAAAGGRLAEARDYGERAYGEDPFMEEVEFTVFRQFEYAFAAGADSAAAHWCGEGRQRFGLPTFDDCRLSLAAWSTVRPLDPDSAWAVAEAELGAYHPAALRRTLEPRVHAMVAAVLARAGHADSARAVLARARARDNSHGLLRASAGVHHLLGETEAALEALRAVAATNAGGGALDHYPELRGILADPRAAAVVGELSRR